jgi:hypothetical protein
MHKVFQKLCGSRFACNNAIDLSAFMEVLCSEVNSGLIVHYSEQTLI